MQVLLAVFSEAFATVISKSINAPLERIRIVLQTQNTCNNLGSTIFDSTSECISRIYAQQGITAFWRGNFSHVVGSLLSNTFLLTCREALESLFPKYDSKSQSLQYFLSGMGAKIFAGIFSLSLSYPLESIYSRLAADVGLKPKYLGLKDCLIKTISGANGFIGIFDGFSASIIGLFPYRVVYFGLHDFFSRSNPLKEDKSKWGLLAKYLIAQLSSIAAFLASYPFDTVMRRLQLQAASSKADRAYNGVVDCFRKTIKNEGIAGFYRGVGFAIAIKVGISVSVLAYEEIASARNQRKTNS